APFGRRRWTGLQCPQGQRPPGHTGSPLENLPLCGRRRQSCQSLSVASGFCRRPTLAKAAAPGVGGGLALAHVPPAQAAMPAHKRGDEALCLLATLRAAAWEGCHSPQASEREGRRRGNSTRKVAPCPGWLSTHTAPPMRCTTCRTM